MEKHIKDWEKPQLIILAKGTPEESVLLNCKTNNPNKQLEGPLQSYQTVCTKYDPNGEFENCSVCQDRGIGAGS
jgi:hypothetical protein